MKNPSEGIPSPQKRLQDARERGIRPSLCVGDVVKRRNRLDRRRDDRLFVVLGIGHQMCGIMYLTYGMPDMTYDGEDYVRIKEYKRKGSLVISIQRRLLWFTGKQLSL